MSHELKLKEGDPAPAFNAPVNGGGRVALSDFAGKNVVLYFYPKDNTPGCNKEACAFRDNYAALQKQGAVVLGVSTDAIKAHDKFAAKFQLPVSCHWSNSSPSRTRLRRWARVWGHEQGHLLRAGHPTSNIHAAQRPIGK